MLRKTMTDEQRKKARNAYMRKYHRRRYAQDEEYRERKRKWNKAYKDAHRDEINARAKEYRDRDPERYHAQQRRSRQRHPETSRRTSLRYIHAHPDRVAEAHRKYDAACRTKRQAEYLRMFQFLDRRVEHIGCRLETDSDTMAVTGKTVVLTDGDLAEVWSSKTYSADLSWLKAIYNAYKQFRKLKSMELRRCIKKHGVDLSVMKELFDEQEIATIDFKRAYMEAERQEAWLINKMEDAK